MAHSNGFESFWSILEHGHNGAFFKFSKNHLQRYFDEFTGYYNALHAVTLALMRGVDSSMTWKVLTSDQLISDNRLSSGVRS